MTAQPLENVAAPAQLPLSGMLPRFKPYPAYRVSGVEWLGVIPAHWQVKRLKYVAEVNPKPWEAGLLAADTVVSFVPMEAVGEYGGLDLSRINLVGDVGNGYTYFRDGDVVVAKITPCFENGKGAYAAGLVNSVAFGTTELHVLRASEHIDGRFLFYITLSDAFRRLGEAEMYGAGGQKRVPDSFVENLKHALPFIAEQRAIAAFLDREAARIDALAAKNERVMVLLQEKRTALITRVVTKGLDPNATMKDSGVDWLGEVPAHWEVAPVYARYEVELGKMLDSKRFTGESPGRYLRNVDVQWDAVNTEELPEMDFAPRERDRYRLRPGDVLVCEGGEVGRTAIWREKTGECFYQKAVHRVRSRSGQDVPRFFYYLMLTVAKRGVFVAGGNPNTIDHLTAVQLKHYRFPFPRLDEQRAIVRVLDQETTQIDAFINEINHAIDRLKELRTALISAAVTGKIDVREEMPA